MNPRAVHPREALQRGSRIINFSLQVYGHLFDDREIREKMRPVAEQLSMLAA